MTGKISGVELAGIRKSVLRMTQREIAESLGVCMVTVSKHENCDNPAPLYVSAVRWLAIENTMHAIQHDDPLSNVAIRHGNDVVAEREKIGVGKTGMAAFFGVSTRTITRLEKRKSVPSLWAHAIRYFIFTTRTMESLCANK